MDDPVRLLLVDDEPRNLDALEAVLGSADVQLVRAVSADEALLALLRGSFAAIVLDIEMPGVGGIELAQLIKQRKRTRDIPILLLAAHAADEREILQGYGAGAVDYLAKPVDPQILRSKITVFVDLFRRKQALARANEALENEIAERQRAEEALRLANEALERQARIKDELLATLSHELRAPLAAIVGWTQLLSQLPTEGKVARGIAVIERKARAQTRLVEDMLDMSRIVSGKVRMERLPIHVSDVVEAAFASVAPSASAKGVQLVKTVSPRSGPVLSDAGRLQQVVWNLLSNAVKFTSAGGRVHVLVETSAEVKIVVQDTGEGIKPALLPHVFDRLRQADGSGTRRHGGLGLSIVQHLVELHGGTVRVESPGEGQGSTFIVELPLRTVTREEEQQVEPAGSSERGAARAVFELPALRGVRVLVVDDEPDMQETIRAMLAVCEADVVTAGSADAALGELQHEPFDVLVSDIGMPVRDGYALIREVRRRESGSSPRLPAIALTSYARSEDRLLAMQEGFNFYLLKPVEHMVLAMAIAKLTRGSRALPPSHTVPG